jgi:hypothetical protein
MKVNWIGHILRRNCLLEHIIEGTVEGRMEVTGRLERRRKQLLGEVKEKRGYFKLNGEALDRTLRRSQDVEIKVQWIYSATPIIRLHGDGKENRTERMLTLG